MAGSFPGLSPISSISLGRLIPAINESSDNLVGDKFESELLGLKMGGRGLTFKFNYDNRNNYSIQFGDVPN